MAVLEEGFLLSFLFFCRPVIRVQLCIIGTVSLSGWESSCLLAVMAAGGGFSIKRFWHFGRSEFWRETRFDLTCWLSLSSTLNLSGARKRNLRNWRVFLSLYWWFLDAEGAAEKRQAYGRFFLFVFLGVESFRALLE